MELVLRGPKLAWAWGCAGWRLVVPLLLRAPPRVDFPRGVVFICFFCVPYISKPDRLGLLNLPSRCVDLHL